MENYGFGNPADKKVLIVDDDDSVRDLLEFIVRKEGFKVEKAADGEEALEKARTVSPDLILLDLKLPRFGGFEILRELQTDDTSDMIKQEPNVKDFIEKPVRPPVLAALIHKLLKTQPLRKPQP